MTEYIGPAEARRRADNGDTSIPDAVRLTGRALKSVAFDPMPAWPTYRHPGVAPAVKQSQVIFSSTPWARRPSPMSLFIENAVSQHARRAMERNEERLKLRFQRNLKEPLPLCEPVREPGTPTAWWKQSPTEKMRMFDRLKDQDPAIQALLNGMDNSVRVQEGSAFWVAPKLALYAWADDPRIQPGQVAVWDWDSPTDRASVNARLYPDVARVAREALDKPPAPADPSQCVDLPDSWRRYPRPGVKHAATVDYQGLALNPRQKAALEEAQANYQPSKWVDIEDVLREQEMADARRAPWAIYSNPDVPIGHVSVIQGPPPAGSTLVPMPEEPASTPWDKLDPYAATAPETDAYDEAPELPDSAKVFLVECQFWGDYEWTADQAFRSKAGAVAYVDAQRETGREADRPYRITAMKLED